MNGVLWLLIRREKWKGISTYYEGLVEKFLDGKKYFDEKFKMDDYFYKRAKWEGDSAESTIKRFTDSDDVSYEYEVRFIKIIKS
jgi:hypothetical protein